MYGRLLMFKITHVKSDSAIPIFTPNPAFDFDLYMLCGGITNSKFWDINLRYAEQACKLDEVEIHSLFLAYATKVITSQWPEVYKKIERQADDKKQTVKAQIKNV